VKSALYEGVKWASAKKVSAVDARWFTLKLPNTPAAKPAVQWLKTLKAPAGTYFSQTGHIQAWQWRFLKHEYRPLWTLKGVKDISDP
jgi:hypothetical protein